MVTFLTVMSLWTPVADHKLITSPIILNYVPIAPKPAPLPTDSSLLNVKQFELFIQSRRKSADPSGLQVMRSKTRYIGMKLYRSRCLWCISERKSVVPVYLCCTYVKYSLYPLESVAMDIFLSFCAICVAETINSSIITYKATITFSGTENSIFNLFIGMK